MSSSKIKNLKLKRHNNSSKKYEDTSIVSIEEIDSHMEKNEKLVKYQESVPPLHSTPKRSSSKSSHNRDQSPSLDNRVSPILLPCTQDGGNEVAWDWQSPITKSTTNKRGRNNGDSIGTPKRATLLQKKRNSNSPLLYNPIKRKIMKHDNQQETIHKFTAEMIALSKQIQTVSKDDENRTTLNENTNVKTDELAIQMDISDFAECETKVELSTSGESTSYKNIKTYVEKTSLDDLFDDSIEDSMVKCSQEVEEKLRLESCGESPLKTNSGGSVVKDFAWHQQTYTNFIATKEKSSGRTTGATSLNLLSSTSMKNSTLVCGAAMKDLKKLSTASTQITNSSITSNTNETKRSNAATSSISSKSSSCLNNNKVTISVTKTSATNVPASTQNEIFVIPDDSFDDDFLDVCLDDVDTATIEKNNVPSTSNKNENNQSSNRYGKVYASPHTAQSDENRPKRSADSIARRALLPPPSDSRTKVSTSVKNDFSTGKLIPRRSSTEALKSSSITTTTEGLPAQSQSNWYQERKFFKSKSLSTPCFDESSTSAKNISNSTSTSSKGWRSNNFSNGNKSSSVSTTQHQTIKAGEKCPDNACSRTNGNERNTGMYNFNRGGTKDDGRLTIGNGTIKSNGVKETATGSQWICTPEEIERKRLEAKMKLEMKRKLQARSKSAGLLSGGVTNTIVKR